MRAYRDDRNADLTAAALRRRTRNCIWRKRIARARIAEASDCLARHLPGRAIRQNDRSGTKRRARDTVELDGDYIRAGGGGVAAVVCRGRTIQLVVRSVPQAVGRNSRVTR